MSVMTDDSLVAGLCVESESSPPLRRCRVEQAADRQLCVELVRFKIRDDLAIRSDKFIMQVRISWSDALRVEGYWESSGVLSCIKN